METSEFLSLSLFCIASKNTQSYGAKIIISRRKAVRIEEKNLLLHIFYFPITTNG